MTWSAQFKVTEVKDGHIRAVASVEDGSLKQNTEHATGMELLVTIDPAAETQMKVGDILPGYGHFAAQAEPARPKMHDVPWGPDAGDKPEVSSC
jgi:hypothetical protein